MKGTICKLRTKTSKEGNMQPFSRSARLRTIRTMTQSLEAITHPSILLQMITRRNFL